VLIHSLSRIALIPLFVVLYYCQPTYTDTPIFTWINFSLTGVYAAISLTDYLDGYLARKLNMTSKLGAFLDPVADKLMVSTALVLLVDYYPSNTHWYISVCALIIISRELSRNTGKRGYRHKQANRLAGERHQKSVLYQ
jgi:CDP-diacylglycerol--glycerol-3-phosphate 3-phosphatidyltransferase